jgi:hypothetical protein
MPRREKGARKVRMEFPAGKGVANHGRAEKSLSGESVLSCSETARPAAGAVVRLRRARARTDNFLTYWNINT